MTTLRDELRAYGKSERRLERRRAKLRVLILEAIEDGAVQNQIAKELGWSRQRLNQWLKDD